MVQNACNMLKEAIREEKDASEFYTNLKKLVSSSDGWKINEIRKEELTHKEELQKIVNRYCHI